VVGNNVVVSTVGCVCGSEEGTPIVTTYQLACATGGQTCDPRWRWTIERTRFLSGITIHSGIAYVLTESAGGKARTEGLGLQVECDGVCRPVVRLMLGKGGSWGTPVVSGGWLFVPGSPGGFLAFPASCRGTCRPTQGTDISRPVTELVPVQDKLLAVSGSRLLLFGMPPASADWRPLWTWQGKGSIERVVVDGNVAVVGLHQRTRAVRLPLHDNSR
jgi:hypothetical protein